MPNQVYWYWCPTSAKWLISNEYIFAQTFNKFSSSNGVKLDNIQKEEGKIACLLRNKKFDYNKGKIKTNRHEIIKVLFNKRVIASGFTNTKHVAERLDLFIIKLKTGRDWLHNEMLRISNQFLSMNFITQKRLDNYIPNYGRYYNSYYYHYNRKKGMATTRW